MIAAFLIASIFYGAMALADDATTLRLLSMPGFAESNSHLTTGGSRYRRGLKLGVTLGVFIAATALFAFGLALDDGWRLSIAGAAVAGLVAGGLRTAQGVLSNRRLLGEVKR